MFISAAYFALRSVILCQTLGTSVKTMVLTSRECLVLRTLAATRHRKELGPVKLARGEAKQLHWTAKSEQSSSGTLP